MNPDPETTDALMEWVFRTLMVCVPVIAMLAIILLVMVIAGHDFGGECVVR